MNSEGCLKSTFFPHSIHIPSALRLKSALSGAKGKKTRGFERARGRQLKNLGARCGQGASHGQCGENWARANFPHLPTTLDSRG
jgi:hypothetical protein